MPETMTSKQVAAAQDAFHYALMAAGGHIGSYESAFVGERHRDWLSDGFKDTEYGRSAWYLRMARQAALVAGVECVNEIIRGSRRSLQDVREWATRLARHIECVCARMGVDANRGMSFAACIEEAGRNRWAADKAQMAVDAMRLAGLTLDQAAEYMPARKP